MKMNRLLCMLLVCLLIVACAGCSKEGSVTPPPDGSLTPPPDGSLTLQPDGSAAQTDPSPNPTDPKPALVGAATPEELVEHIAAFFHGGCQGSELEGYYNPDAWLVYLLADEDKLPDSADTMESAMDVIAKMHEGEQALRAAYPAFAQELMDEFDLEDGEENLQEFFDDLAWDLENGEISAEDPDYDTLRRMVADRDKGTDYLCANYPDFLDLIHQHGICLGLQDGLDYILAAAADLRWLGDDSESFRDSEFTFDSSRVFGHSYGFFSTQISSADLPSNPLLMDMIYYCADGRYLLANLKLVVSSYGG